MLKIYHNPRCGKSREGLRYLVEHGYDHEIIQYLDNPLKPDDLKRILMKLNMKPFQVVRTNEELFRKELKGKSFTDDEWIKLIIQNPKLLQRPIIESKYKAIVAIPPEKIEELNKK